MFAGSLRRTLLAGVMLAGTISAAQANEVTLRFAHIWAATHPFHTCGAERMQEALANDPSGVRLRLYPAEQLGTMAQTADSVVAGNVDMSIFGSSYLGTRYDPVAVLDAAYVFRDYDHASRVNDSEIGQKLWEGLLQNTGIRRLDNWIYGARHITANKEIKSPSDLAGVKFRVPDNALMVANARALGATPVPMAFGEVYLALQQGTIDAQENPLTVIESQKFHEVQDHLALTAHMIQVSPVVISERTWQRLNEEQRSALQRVIDEVTPQVNECVIKEEEQLVDQWKSAGAINVIAQEDIDIDAFRNRAREELLKTQSPEWGELYKAIQDFQ